MRPLDYYEIPIKSMACFVESAGPSSGLSFGGKRSQSAQGAEMYPAPNERSRHEKWWGFDRGLIKMET
jgi:hypothetical protein